MNKAVYIAKYNAQGIINKGGKHANEWTATGTQFQIPYVFKKLFSHEEIEFKDMCETKQVSSAIYLDMNENLPDVSKQEAERSSLIKKYADKNGCYPFDIDDCIQKLTSEIKGGHNYHFVGKVGLFCPMKPGAGGGLLVRESVDKKTGETKYDAVTGTDGWRWMEAEMVKQLGKQEDIEKGYYNKLCDAAIYVISFYGDYEWFVSDQPYIGPWYDDGRPQYEPDIPF